MTNLAQFNAKNFVNYVSLLFHFFKIIIVCLALILFKNVSLGLFMT